MLSVAAKRLIGIGAILAAILIVALGITRPNPFRESTVYYAKFDSVHGLGATGRDIRVGGVNVGTIGDVSREGDDAVVELELTEDIAIHDDASAAMRPHTLFEGSSFIDLAPGTPGAPLLDAGERIPLRQTSNYVTLDEALRVLRPQIRESLRELAASGARTLRGEAISGTQRLLRNAPGLAKHAAGPARALQGSKRTELQGAIAGISETVDAVARREDELIPLNRRLAQTMAALTVDGGTPLDASLANLPGAIRELHDGAPALTELVDRLDRLAVVVNPALPDLTSAVGGATPLLRRSIPVITATTPLVRDLRKVGDRLAEAAPTLALLMRRIDPVADTFGGSVLPVLLSDSRSGPKVYEQLLAMFTAANAVWRPYQTTTQGAQGSGHLWQIGTYIEPSAISGPFAVRRSTVGPDQLASCNVIATVSRRAARMMVASGGCE